MAQTRAASAAAEDQAERVAAWLTDREPVELVQAPHDIARLALRLRRDRAFRRKIEQHGADAASRGAAIATVASTTIQRLGHIGRAYVERQDPSQIPRVLEELTELQSEVVHAFLRGYSSVVPVSAAPTNREQLLDSTIQALDRINADINSSLELEEVLRLTVGNVADMLNVSEVTIYLYEPAIDRLILRATRTFNPDALGHTTLAIGEGLIGWTAKVGQPLVVRDVWGDHRFRYVPGLGEERVRSFLAVPIVLFTVNRLIGVLNIASTEFRDFTAEEVRFAEITAGQLAIAVENARLHQQTDEALHRKIEQLTSVQNMTKTLVSNLDLRSVLAQVARQAAQLTGADKAAIWRIDEAGDGLRIVAGYELGSAYTSRTLRMGEGVVGQAVARRAPVIVRDALDDDLITVPRALIEEEGFRAMFSVPLIAGDRVLGAISLYSSEPDHFTNEQTELATAFGNQAAIALENARLFEEVRQGLDTKSLLLKEMHHRVKNNMQTIGSLLEMQARRARTDEAASLLKLSAGRIAGMARVHDLLSQDDVGLTTAHAIIEAMVNLMRTDLGASDRHVELSVKADPVSIASDKASVFALVVNELLWNAVQHGLDGHAHGSIEIVATKAGPELDVSVRDDGRGLPSEFSLDRDTGLGLSIVRNVVERNLEGSFEIRAGPDGRGAVATLRFVP